MAQLTTSARRTGFWDTIMYSHFQLRRKPWKWKNCDWPCRLGLLRLNVADETETFVSNQKIHP